MSGRTLLNSSVIFLWVSVDGSGLGYWIVTSVWFWAWAPATPASTAIAAAVILFNIDLSFVVNAPEGLFDAGHRDALDEPALGKQKRYEERRDDDDGGRH